MAFIDPTSFSTPQDQKWVVEIREILHDELKINVETPRVSIFQVPETITATNPEAYVPQQIGLGPIHHFRPGPYQNMEQKKLAIVRKVLRDYKIAEDGNVVFNKVRELVPIVRSCYGMFLQGNDNESLAVIFAIDGLFLLNLLRTYNSGMEKEMEEYLAFLKDRAETFKGFQFLIEENYNLDPLLLQENLVVTAENRTQWEHILGLPHHRVEKPKVGLRKRSVAQDILMIENQIPFMVLKEIDEALHSSLGNNSSQSSNKLSLSIIRTFCKVHSPLQLCSKSQAPSSVDHLLHYMYYSIVNNTFIEIPDHLIHDQPLEKEEENRHEVEESLVIQAYTLFSKIPQKEIVQVYEQTVTVLESFCKTQSNLIPSASKLHDKLGIKFHSLIKHKGIQNIGIRGKDMYLPCITLNSDSGVILRNLVAYETITSTSDSFPLTDYVHLMCALILNVEDVKLLRSGNVITGDLGDDEVTKLFIGLSSSIPTMKTNGKSKLMEMIDEINEAYKSALTMKAYLFLKKLARWLLVVLKAIGGFIEASWKVAAFVASIVAVVMLTSQAYCDVYGCDKTTVTMLPYSSS